MSTKQVDAFLAANDVFATYLKCEKSALRVAALKNRHDALMAQWTEKFDALDDDAKKQYHQLVASYESEVKKAANNDESDA